MLSLPVLILLAVIVLGALACVGLAWHSHHTTVSLLEQHKASASRQAAFPGSGHDPFESLQAAPRRRRRRRGLGGLLFAAVVAVVVYLWQSGASAATTAAHPVLASHVSGSAAQAGAAGWAVPAGLVVVVLAYTFWPRHGRKNGR